MRWVGGTGRGGCSGEWDDAAREPGVLGQGLGRAVPTLAAPLDAHPLYSLEQHVAPQQMAALG